LKTLVLTLVFVALLQSPAQAGLFDFLFSGKQDNATTQSGLGTPKYGGTMMTGSDLILELRGIKAGIAAPDPMQSLAQLFMPPTEQELAAAKAAQDAKEAKEKEAKEKAAKGKGKPKKTKGKDKKTEPEPPPPAPPAPATETAPAQNAAAPGQTEKGKPGNEFQQLVNSLSGLSSIAGGSSGSARKSSLGSASSLGSVITDTILDRLIACFSFRAMDIMFSQLIDQPGVLSAVNVEVPATEAMHPELRKRVLYLSAFLVAIKASNRVVQASQKDFDSAKESYKSLMKMRQDAAQVLADAYFKRNQAASLAEEDAARGTTSLRPQDLELLTQLGAAKPEDFVKDPRVQTVAIDLMRQSDPDTYGRYNSQFTEMKNHYNAYARAAAGTASMLGFTALFIKKANATIRQDGVHGAATMLPLLDQGIMELLALAPNMIKIYNNTDETVSGSFAVERANKLQARGLSAPKALAALNDKARQELRCQLVNGGATGMLANLHMVAPAAAASLADRVVSPGSKKALAKQYAADQEIFSFVNTQAESSKAAKTYKNISQALFIQRQPDPGKDCTGETGEQALMLAQRDLLDGASKFENSDLRKIMYAMNNAPGGADLRMAVGDSVVRIDNLGIEGLIDQQTLLEERMKVHAAEQSYAEETAKKAAVVKRKKK